MVASADGQISDAVLVPRSDHWPACSGRERYFGQIRPRLPPTVISILTIAASIFERYYDPEFARAEFEKIWIKTWLFACREEDIPNIGDRAPLHIGPLSWFVVHSGKDSFKAYHNSCLHRGTMLCIRSESAQSIRCPYHGWEWSIDGRLMNIPNHWDFPKATRTNGQSAFMARPR